MSDCERSIRLLKTNERLWANRSCCSRQMSDREQIAQVIHYKWATVSDSLRSLIINELMSDSLKNCWQKKSKILFFSMFYISFLFKKLSDSLIPSFLMLRLLTKNERCEQITQVTYQKWATISDLLRSLTKNERLWANRSGCSPKMSEWVNPSFFERIAHSLIFSQKISDSLRKPSSEFPAQVKIQQFCIRSARNEKLYFCIVEGSTF